MFVVVVVVVLVVVAAVVVVVVVVVDNFVNNDIHTNFLSSRQRHTVDVI